MKFVGISSPCWTIKANDTQLKGKPQEVLENQRSVETSLGPGKYSTEKEFRVLKKVQSTYSFGGAQRFPEMKADLRAHASGHNTQEVNTKKPEKSSIRQAPNDRLKRRFKSMSGAAAQSFFGTSLRTEFSKNHLRNPGPGTYETSGDVSHDCPQKYSFGYKVDNDGLAPGGTDTNLGPGSYNPKYLQFIKGIKMVKSVVPGKPASSNEKSISTKRDQSIDVVCASDRKDAKPPRKTHQKQNSTFAKASRDEFYKNLLKQMGPGPANYNTADINPAQLCNWKAKAFSLGGRHPQNLEKIVNPVGPDAYHINLDIFKSSRGFTFSKAQDLVKVDKRPESKDSFESNSVEKENAVALPKFRGGDMGKAERYLPDKSHVPGPGSYNPKLEFTRLEAPAVSIGSKVYHRKYRVWSQFDAPAPQVLEPRSTGIDPNPKFGRFGKASREASQPIKRTGKRGVSGDYYNIAQQIGGGGFSFGKALKVLQEADQNVEIGPGFYELKSTIPQPQPWVKFEGKI